MATISAKDVQALRQASGAGMMDAKKALAECDGDAEKAMKYLREKGLAAVAKRADRDNDEGAVAVSITDSGAAIVELKCETDFVAKNADFVNLVNEMAAAVASKGTDATEQFANEIQELNTTLKENIQLGRVEYFDRTPGTVVDSYLHVQADRGVNAVLVEVSGGDAELAHNVAVHVAFARPKYLTRDDVPAAEVAEMRETYEAMSRNEGKPEAALPKIIAGRLTGFYKEVVLVDQPYARDEKQSIAGLLDEATITRFAQVVVGS